MRRNLCLLWEWERLEIKDRDYSNHLRFSLRCLSKDVIPVSVWFKTTVNSTRAREIIHKAERQLLQDRVKGMNGILQENRIKLDICRSRLSSIVTRTTMCMCTEFINKVRESRFIKVRDRQVNKFSRLMGYKDKKLTTQPSVNTTQLQAHSKPNKWEINLFSTPLSQA